MGQCACCEGVLARVRSYDFKSPIFRKIYTDRSVYKCTACGLVQADCSRVNDAALTQYYAHDYRAVAKIAVADSEADHSWFAQRGEALARLASQHLSRPPERVFELGAGYGYNLLALKAAFPGASLFSDDLDETIVVDSSISPGVLEAGEYDVIVLSHVLEHFTDPRDLVRRAVAATAPGGLVVIEVPNDVEGIVPLNGPDEPHLTFFTHETLSRLLAAAKVDVLDLFPAGPSYQRRSLKTQIRALVKSLLSVTAKPLLDAVRAKRAMERDLSQPNPRGVFLRAVLTRA